MIFLTAILIFCGSTFILLGAIGVVRFPDVFMRMHASTKAGILGSSIILLAVMVYYQQLGVTTRMTATILFLYLTTPVAAHAIGRAAYFAGTPLWEGTYVDELHGNYDAKTHRLKSHTPPKQARKKTTTAKTSRGSKSSLAPKGGEG